MLPLQVMLSLQQFVKDAPEDELGTLPPIFWACISMLHTQNVHLFRRVVLLFSALLCRLDLATEAVQRLLLKSLPQVRPNPSFWGFGGRV